MSYAIIRNEKYTKDEMTQLAPHNERMKKEYSNKNIDLSRTSQNYHLKRPVENTYLKEYKRLVSENGLNQGQVHSNSIFACEMIITSDSAFFEQLGAKETKRYFEECYEFISYYNNLGKENILSAVVHLDESSRTLAIFLQLYLVHLNLPLAFLLIIYDFEISSFFTFL